MRRGTLRVKRRWELRRREEERPAPSCLLKATSEELAAAGSGSGEREKHATGFGVLEYKDRY